MPVSLYGASVPAKTFGTVDGAVTNPTDFEETIDADVAKVLGANSCAHIPGFEEFSRNPPKSANRVNSMEKIKGRESKPILRSVIYCICNKRLIN